MQYRPYNVHFRPLCLFFSFSCFIHFFTIFRHVYEACGFFSLMYTCIILFSVLFSAPHPVMKQAHAATINNAFFFISFPASIYYIVFESCLKYPDTFPFLALVHLLLLEHLLQTSELLYSLIFESFFLVIRYNLFPSGQI